VKIPKQINVKTALIFVAIGILITSLVFYGFAATPSSTFYISSGVYPGAPSYTVWREGSNYFAKDENGQLRYSGTNFTEIGESCIDNLPTYGGKILLKTGVYEGWIVIDRDGVILEGEGVYSDIPVGIPDHSPTALYGSVIKVTTANKHGIHITGQRFGVQIRNLGIWFTQSSTGCGITTDTTQTYTLTHCTIENVKFLNCDKDSYAIRLANFLHLNIKAIMSFGGPLLEIYANMPDFHQGNSIFDNLFGFIKYDLSPVVEHTGPYPIFIHRNDSATTTMSGLLDMRRIQINNPTGCADSDYWTVYCANLGYSSLSDFDFEGSNCQNHTMRMGSCEHLTFINLYMWEMDPSDAYLSVASNNKYITFIDSYLEKLLDSNHTDTYINCQIIEPIDSNTQASFINLVNNTGVATLTGSTVTVAARFIGPNDYVVLTIIEADSVASGDFIKVDTINNAPTNTFVVNCGDESAPASAIIFYWEIKHATP